MSTSPGDTDVVEVPPYSETSFVSRSDEKVGFTGKPVLPGSVSLRSRV